jgi:alpha-ribazole phosphatase
MRMYLIRHGESVSDAEDCFGGIADFAMTPRGRRGAHELAERLANSGIAGIYSSPYRRALETATILQSRLSANIQVVPGLRERNCFGVLSGVSRARANELFPHVLKDIQGRPGDFYSGELVPGAEPVPEFVARVKQSFGYLVSDAHGLPAIAIATHGNVIRAVYRDIVGIAGRVNVEHLSVTVLDIHDGGAIVLESVGVAIE